LREGAKKESKTPRDKVLSLNFFYVGKGRWGREKDMFSEKERRRDMNTLVIEFKDKIQSKHCKHQIHLNKIQDGIRFQGSAVL
jgi:hypothetical protein